MGEWVEFWLPKEPWELEVCFSEDYEENWESWGKKRKKKRMERREKIIIF